MPPPRLLAAHNYDVAIGYNSDQAGAKNVAQDVEKSGGKAILLKADIGKPEEIEQMFNTLNKAMPRLDALVHNAASYVTGAHLDVSGGR